MHQLKEGKKEANGIARTFRSLREWESAGLTSHGFFFLSFPSLYSRFSCSPRFQPRVVRSFASTIGPCRCLCEGLPDCKGNRANVRRPRGGACTRLAKLLINAHGKNLSLSLSLSFRALPRDIRDCMTAHVKASWVWLIRSSACCNTRNLDHSVTTSSCDLVLSPLNENYVARNSIVIAQREFVDVKFFANGKERYKKN